MIDDLKIKLNKLKDLHVKLTEDKIIAETSLKSLNEQESQLRQEAESLGYTLPEIEVVLEEKLLELRKLEETIDSLLENKPIDSEEVDFDELFG
jgi:uncharacterized protein YhaN